MEQSKILVLFGSATGNVMQMAELVVEGAVLVPDTEVRVRSVEEAKASDVEWCDGLAVGSPTNMGVLSWKMKRFWDEEMIDSWMKVDGKIAVPLAVREGGVEVWIWRANRFTRC